MSQPAGVELHRVSKRYGSFQAVNDLSLTIVEGEMVSLLGPSGCGKTTTLRMVAGLEMPDVGELSIGGRAVTRVPPWRRNIGMVFQSYALFPHLSVVENLAYGLQMRRCPRAEIGDRVARAIKKVHLEGFEARFPAQLSGGQRQRVALARALVVEPSVLLFDEPLAALDKKLREQLQVEIREIQREAGITAIFVTHDQEEALTLSDRVVVMNAGSIVQIGKPEEVYKRPATKFVSEFVGAANPMSAAVIGCNSSEAAIRLPWGQEIVVSANGVRPGGNVDLVIRPENLKIGAVPKPGQMTTQGILTHHVYMGAVSQFHIDVGGVKLVALSTDPLQAAADVGEPRPIQFVWSPADVVVLRD